jgi:hypothetical protein
MLNQHESIQNIVNQLVEYPNHVLIHLLLLILESDLDENSKKNQIRIQLEQRHALSYL